MKPYTPPTRIGRSKGGHDIHHKTADLGPGWRNATAKKAKHAARQHAKKDTRDDGQNSDSAVTVPREEYDALLRDKARLDYLEAAHAALNERYGTNYGWELIINHNVVRFMAGNSYPRDDGFPGIDLHDSKGGNAKLPTCRDAIDKYLPTAQADCSP